MRPPTVERTNTVCASRKRNVAGVQVRITWPGPGPATRQQCVMIFPVHTPVRRSHRRFDTLALRTSVCLSLPPLHSARPLRPKNVAVRIAGQLICPVTLRPWEPPIEDTRDCQPHCARPLHPSTDAGYPSDAPGPGYLRQATGADDAASLNHVTSVFPREGEDLRTWNVQRLILFMNVSEVNPTTATAVGTEKHNVVESTTGDAAAS